MQVSNSVLPTDASSTLDAAADLCWSAPELALPMAEGVRQRAHAEGDRVSWLEAESVALFAAHRLGRSLWFVDRAIDAVHEAATLSEIYYVDLLGRLHLEFARCARVVGETEIAVRTLEPLADKDHLAPLVRADALTELVRVLPGEHHDAECVALLGDAEELCAHLPRSQADVGRCLRTEVHAVRAARLRARCAQGRAQASAQDGLELCRNGRYSRCVGASARLDAELVFALLERSKQDEAVAHGEKVLSNPVRPAEVEPYAWMRLALVTEVFQPSGLITRGRSVLAETADEVGRAELDELRARSLAALADLCELQAHLSEALSYLRQAHAAERRWQHARFAARLRLTSEFPAISARVPRQWRWEDNDGAQARAATTPLSDVEEDDVDLADLDVVGGAASAEVDSGSDGVQPAPDEAELETMAESSQEVSEQIESNSTVADLPELPDDAGLADLLAGALLAYRTGSRGNDDDLRDSEDRRGNDGHGAQLTASTDSNGGKHHAGDRENAAASSSQPSASFTDTSAVSTRPGKHRQRED